MFLFFPTKLLGMNLKHAKNDILTFRGSVKQLMLQQTASPHSHQD
jgi:hypothetical protein